MDADGKPRCPNDHKLKRFDAPFANGRGSSGRLGCDVCKKKINV